MESIRWDLRERDEVIYNARMAGRTVAELAKEFGISTDAVRAAEFRHNRRKEIKTTYPADSIAHLSVRTANCLRNAGLERDARAADICTLDPEELIRTPNFGRRSMAEVQEFLNRFNLSFGRPHNRGKTKEENAVEYLIGLGYSITPPE